MSKKIILSILVAFILLSPFNSLIAPCAAQGGGGGGGGGRGGMGGMAGGRGGMAGGFGGGGSTVSSSIVGADSSGSLILIPLPQQKQIIVKAPAELMRSIAAWIEVFDVNGTTSADYDVMMVRYADAQEVVDSVNTLLQDMSSEITQSIYLYALPTSRQIFIFGKPEGRVMVKELIQIADVQSDLFQTVNFDIRYADPEDIKSRIDEMFSYLGQSGSSTTGTATRTTTMRTSTAGGSSMSADTVSVLAITELRRVTVIASEENIATIAKLIEEWDQPIDKEKLKPRIIELKNVDPIEMVNLLTSLFSDSAGGTGASSTNTRQMLTTTYGTTTSTGERIVGQLYGKFTFADVPGTRKIIVISNIPEAYDVIEDLILDLDREEMAQVPEQVILNYADAEDLSRRLNALFADTGQSASIPLTTTGLNSASSMGSSTTSSSTTTTYTPPWSGASGGGGTDEEMPVSNVFGKVRFMPEPSTKSILILAPEQFIGDLRALVELLDVAGKQVMIETAIVEVKHEKMSSIGSEFTQSGTLDAAGIFSLSPGITAIFPPTTLGSTTVGNLVEAGDFTLTGTSMSIKTVIDFLVNNADGRILNQQTLWTKDNAEAQFFKGKVVPFITGSTTTTSGGVPTTQYTYQRNSVGMEVRVRPSITPEKNVNMIVNVNYSQLAGIDTVSQQTVTSDMVSTTNMIVPDGETLILGGIIFQTDNATVNKIPGLGDIPVIGGLLFSHSRVEKTNNELLVFLTPHVIDKAPELLDELIEQTKEAIAQPRIRFNEIKEELSESMDVLNSSHE